ncbi:hypothetical protein MMB232_01293 [Brevundimonas subvibrioides]|uniref:hypothetical protein n=1 Tax=Brevundimonas subvibrioides TaxID=74313 RepID=UPI0032D5794B
MKRGWFGPKRWGWGASPATAEGWAVIGVFILAMGATGYLVDEPVWRWAVMLVEIALLLVVIARTYDKNARTGV